MPTTSKSMLKRLYTQDINAVRNILHGYEADWEVVDDLVQDVFKAALEAPYAYHSKPLTWLLGIAKHVGAHHVRAQGRQKRAFEVLESGIDALGEEVESREYYERDDLSAYIEQASANLDPALSAEADDLIESAVDDMSPRMGCVLRNRLEGHSNATIAGCAGTSEGAVRAITARAKKYFAQECNNMDFKGTNRIRAPVLETSILDWSNRAKALPKRVSMDKVRQQQAERFGLADKAIRLRNQRRKDDAAT